MTDDDNLQDWLDSVAPVVDTEHAKRIENARLRRAPTFAEMKARFKQQLELKAYAKAIGTDPETV